MGVATLHVLRRPSVGLPWILLGVIFGTKISLGGEIFFAELFSIASLPFFMLSGRVRREEFWLLILGLFWGCIQLVSDLANRTELISLMKGVLAPVFLCSTIVSLCVITRDRMDRMSCLLLGVGIAGLIQVIFLPTENQVYEPWKWGYGPLVLFLGLVVVSFFLRLSNAFVALLMLIFTAVCMLTSVRSLAVLPVLGYLAYLFWTGRRFTRFKAWLSKQWAPLKVLLIVSIAVIVLNATFGFVFSSGWLNRYLSPDVAAKYERQATSDVGLLLAGRSESLVSISAILDSPIIGHGSWAEDRGGYLAEYAALRYRYGITETPTKDRRPYIPAHSYLLGAMVWGGIGGGLFWIAFSAWLIRKYVQSSTLLPLYFHVGIVTFVWNLLFSPFGADARWGVALFVFALMNFCTLTNRSR